MTEPDPAHARGPWCANCRASHHRRPRWNLRLAPAVVAVLLLPGPVLAQANPTAEQLVMQMQLLAPEQRVGAREQLLALGKAAVPALLAGLEAVDEDVRTERMAVLVELGPVAGSAVPELKRLVTQKECPALVPTLEALAELVPYRDAAVAFDQQVLTDIHVKQLLMRQRGQVAPADPVLTFQRLRVRFEFPSQLDQDELVTAVQSYNAFRVELAIELLGQRGVAEPTALAALRALLERPEPRILTTERTVPLHRKAARAILAMAPASAEAELARRVLAGELLPQSPSPPIPERARTRVAELVTELARPDKRAAAAANLVALGAIAVGPIAATLQQDHDVEFVAAALGILGDLGPRAASAVPQLFDALLTLPIDHTIAVLHALRQTGPWCRDLVPSLSGSWSVGRLEIAGRHIKGNPDAAFLNEYQMVAQSFHMAMSVDPGSSLRELQTMLSHPMVVMRERALIVLRERGVSARPLLPVLVTMLSAEQPSQHVMKMLDAQSSTSERIDRTSHLQRLAAMAILAIATADDPAVAAARAVLERPEIR